MNTIRSNGKGVRTLGPLADLEAHLPTEWWRELFDSIYLRTDGDVVEHDGNTAREVELLVEATGIRSCDRLLDLCCGQGRHAIALAAQGYEHVTGIDRSRYLVRLARKRSRSAGLSIQFQEGDARKFRASKDGYDCIFMMGNSFGYFDTREEDSKVLDSIKATLRSGGKFAIDITDGEWMRKNFEPRSWEWIDRNLFVCRERTLSADGDRLVSREVVVHAERGVLTDRFYAERLYSRNQIQELIGEAGFREIRFHGTVAADSSRGQDLGMMAHRLFLTGIAPRKHTSVGKSRCVEVTVLLGDPRLPDVVKKDGHFGVEDLRTVDRLKDALAEVKGYSFRYLDHHATFIRDLESSPPDLVLNLCDEGWNNKATEELHVPAVLEILKIPYTGGTPSCLALCYDKSLVQSLAGVHDIPVPLQTYVGPADHSARLPSTFPALLKPNEGDSSVGITSRCVVENPQDLVDYLKYLQTNFPNQAVLVQEFLTGAEYSVTLIGNAGVALRALPILEVDFSQLSPELPRILSYESKWDPASPGWTDIRYREAKIDAETEQTLIAHSTVLFERLGCKDYARFDFRADSEGTIKLLEVNPNPGWCWDGKMNLMAEFASLRYSELLGEILAAATERLGQTVPFPAVRASAARPFPAQNLPVPDRGIVQA